MSPEGVPEVELWGGVECTVNRVHDTYFDQVERSGHATRASDLDAFAALGLRALRYPVLWERVAPSGGLRRADFTWSDERLARLRRLGIRPIVGLVHHGSGPRSTSLLDPAFASGLAEYARAVAERYPWVTEWIPVNEPVTTARFSGLYGHWYPHERSASSFVRALLVQCRATVLAMRAIRCVCPGARLVQTEDFGATFSTPLLAYQARHENLRRLLSVDLLCGKVDRAHPLYRYLVTTGATEDDLAFFLDAGSAPDVIGVNYYLTSDRFLDQRLERYPAHWHGGNGRHGYADVEAVRVREDGITGHLALLLQLHERYGLPLAITEVHLGGPREEQIRWFLEAWRAAIAARDLGADVRAVTAWSLLGAFDWDSLVVRQRGQYEAGALDVRSSPPRRTAVAELLGALGAGRSFNHPAACGPGWWRRPIRFAYPEVSARSDAAAPRVEAALSSAAPRPRPILVAGASGTLGRAFARLCADRGIAHELVGRDVMDIADPPSVAAALDRHEPWAVINAAGYVRVDDAERERERCERENTLGPAALARACADRGVRLVTFSSDLVFGGGAHRPYVESDDVSPLGVYGASKALAERAVLSADPSCLVVRTSAFFGPWDTHSFVAVALAALLRGEPFRAAADIVVSPTYVPDLVNATLDLLIDGASGIWHLANRGEISWADLALRSAGLAGVDASTLLPCPGRELGLVAPRPSYSALGSQRGVLLPALDESLSRYVRERDLARVRRGAG